MRAFFNPRYWSTHELLEVISHREIVLNYRRGESAVIRIALAPSLLEWLSLLEAEAAFLFVKSSEECCS